MSLVGLATWGYQEGTTRSSPVSISVRPLPEGVWLAVSDRLPGLIVETDTREEAIDLAREMALELMELHGERPDHNNQQFAFIFDQI